MQRLGEMQILNNHVDINNNNKKKQQRNQFLVSLRNSDLHDGWRSLLCPLICPCCPLLWHCCAAPARGRTPGPPDAESRPVSVGWPSVTGNSGSSSRPRQQPAASACRPAESHTRHTWEKIRSKEREKRKKKTEGRDIHLFQQVAQFAAAAAVTCFLHSLDSSFQMGGWLPRELTHKSITSDSSHNALCLSHRPELTDRLSHRTIVHNKYSMWCKYFQLVPFLIWLNSCGLMTVN